MIAFLTDEISHEVYEKEIPNLFIATSPCITYIGDGMESYAVSQDISVAYFMGGVEGLLTPLTENIEEVTVDDEEYPARRKVSVFENGTIIMEARFGRNMRWMFAIHRTEPALARSAVEAWLESLNKEVV